MGVFRFSFRPSRWDVFLISRLLLAVSHTPSLGVATHLPLFICSSIANMFSQILSPEAKPFYSLGGERVIMSGHEDGWRQNLMAPGLRAATQRRLVPQQMRFTAAYASAACPRPRSADPRTEPACESTYVLHAFPSGAVVHLSVPPG